MAIRWYGLVAPEEAVTGDRRMFAADSLGYRDFPLPAAWQRVSGSGHAGSVVVASWERQYAGDGGIWGQGTFLDPTVVPEVIEAMYLLQRKLIGPSVDLDPDLAYEVVAHPTNPEESAFKVTKATVHGVTFVMGPAFPQVHITVEDDSEAALLASSGISYTFAVNKSSWQAWPVAERETTWAFEDAINRIAAWSGGDAKKFAQAFLWRNDEGDPNNRETYRAPLADVINGKLVLIPRAVMAAATMLSGGHGGFEDIPEPQRIQMQEVITQIYDQLRETYGDPRFIAPWQRGGRAGATSSADTPAPSKTASLDTLELIDGTFQSRLDGPLEDYWVRGEGAAKIRWGTPGSFDRCVRLLADKFPQDTEGLCANLHHEATGKWPAEGKDRSEHAMDTLESLTAAGQLYPPKSWFDDPRLSRPTPLQITDDGRVFGHLATWKTCHLGVGNKCVMAPKSATGYAHFHLGSVKTQEGVLVPVGKITLGTGHADKRFGVQPAAQHYDDTGTAVAVVRAGEDSHGIWVAGGLTAELAEHRVAELRRSPLSGDWRRVNGNLELVAALAVNDPGFPVLHDDRDGSYSLVAAGILVDEGLTSQSPHEHAGVGEPASSLAAFDEFLNVADRRERAEIVQRIYHEMLPSEEGCGCHV